MSGCRGCVISALHGAGAAACLVVSDLGAQSATGKVEGQVVDQAGAPIAGAQVYLVGTAFGASTDASGQYFINNVPAGARDIRAIFIGHQPVEALGLRVLAGQTVTQDFALAAAPLQLQEIQVVAAENVLVPRDEVTTKQRMDGQLADMLPVDRITTLIALQPGVVEVTNSILSGRGRNTESGLSIRGGRPTQNVTYIDGVPVEPGYKGDRLLGWRDLGATGSTFTIGTNALEEASVTTGSPSAEFGNASAGLISIVTRTGDHRYRGSLGFETDEPFGVNHGPGFNRVEAGLSGPLGPKLTFAINGLLEGQQSVEEGLGSQDVPVFLRVGVDTTIRQPSVLTDDPSTGHNEALTADTTDVRIYQYAMSRGRCDHFATAGSAGLAGADSTVIRKIRDNYGVDCSGVRLPETPRTFYSFSGRFNYSYGKGSRLSLSLGQSRFHGYSFSYPINYLARLAAAVARGFSNRSRIATVSWTQNLSRTAERALALDLHFSYQQDRTISGPLTTDSRASTRNPWGGFILEPLGFLYDWDNFPVDDALIRNVRLGLIENRTTPRQIGNGSYDNSDELRDNAYGLYGDYRGLENTMGGIAWTFGERPGIPGSGPLNLYQENRYIGKATVDWQADRFNRVKLGAELTRYGIDHYASFLDANFASEAYIERPIRWNVFLENRLDLGDVIVVGGLRYDWYHTRASRPYVADTLGARYQFPRIGSLPGVDPGDPTAHFVPDQSHGYLSPHVQVSFPVSDRSNFRLSYSHQVQGPDFGLLLAGINGDLASNTTAQAFGTDLDFGKTIAIEFGIRHAFSEDMVVDVAAYNRNVLADPAARLVTRYDPVTGFDTQLKMLTNLDYGTVRGIDVRLDRRLGSFLNGTLGYSYQDARSTGSDPFSYINFGSRMVNEIGGIGGAQPPPQAIFPTDFSRPHAFTGALVMTFPFQWKPGSVLGAVLADVSIFSTFRYTSGSAYSRCADTTDEQNVLSSEFCIRGSFLEGLNSRRLPAFKEFNARLTKGMALGGLDLTAYLDVRNLFNFKNVLQVFAVNGSTRNDRERSENLQADLDGLEVERDNNDATAGDGESLQLPAAHEDCARWVSSRHLPAAANCMYLIRAEQRWGNGDGMFTVEEQTAAINSLYDVARGQHQHVGPGRRARIGMEIDF